MDLEPWRNWLLDRAPEAMARTLTLAFVIAAVAGILLLKPLLRLMIGRATPPSTRPSATARPRSRCSTRCSWAC